MGTWLAEGCTEGRSGYGCPDVWLDGKGHVRETEKTTLQSKNAGSSGQYSGRRTDEDEQLHVDARSRDVGPRG